MLCRKLYFSRLFSSISMNGFKNGFLSGKVIPTTDQNAIQIATGLLDSDQVIALPTDTVYGLACNANNEKAIQNLYKIKGRDGMKPVAICVADYEDFYHWGEAQHLEIKMLHQLLPGPVTIVVNKSVNLSNPFLNNGISKIGIRIPDFPFIRNLCRSFREPIALTSANKSSEKSTLNVEEFSGLWSELGAVFDGGQLGITEIQRSASTVIDLSKREFYQIIRQGIAVKHTESIVQSYGIKPK